MAKTTHVDITARAPSTFLLLALVASSITPSRALNVLLGRADSCPKSYSRCESPGLPDSFCCPSSSTCVSLDGGTSAICCPKGQSCSYIQPITCDVQLQNAALHQTNSIKTTRLNDDLPKCGDSCCPFGYKCKGNEMCEMDDKSSSPPTSTKSGSTHTATSASSKQHPTATESNASSTTDPAAPTIVSPTHPKTSSSLSSNSNSNSTAAALAGNCPSYPSKAVLAGFFPGAIFGAVLAALGMTLFRRWQQRQLPVSEKVAQYTQRSSNGTLIGISSPIPTEDTSYRTDFLLRRSRSSKRSSEGARSVLHRTGTRVKSLFASTPKITVQPPSETVPQVPQVPQVPSMPVPPAPAPAPALPVTPPRQMRPPRQPSTESIRVYTPPGVFANTSVLKPDPYPSFRPETTFTDMIDRVGFKDNKGDPAYRVAADPRDSPGRGSLRIPPGR